MTGWAKYQLARFLRRPDAGVSVETIIILPVVLWAFLAVVVYFDLFRAVTTSQRAAYTVADSISRQQNDALTADQIETYNRIFAYLAEARHTTAIRVSSIIWNPVINDYAIAWSYGADGRQPLTDADITEAMRERLPTVPTQDSVIVVETAMDYRPILSQLLLSGTVLRERRLQEFVVTRPRFVPQIVFDDGTNVFGTQFPTCDDPGVICYGEDPLGI